jgi:GNAT superfamily N-acetyltransferase
MLPKTGHPARTDPTSEHIMQMEHQAVTVQPLTAEYLPQALALSQALRWPFRLEDWAFALSLGQGLAVELDGRLAGTALWWPYGEDYAAAGMIIVANDAQRRGIGAALMRAMLQQTQGRTLILNSTEEGRRLYENLGFVALGRTVHQHQAVLHDAPRVKPEGTVRDLQAADMPVVRALDRCATGLDRVALIEALFAMGRVRVIEQDGTVSGYGCVRTWGRGVVIGPVVARDASSARALIADLAASEVGAFVRIDVTSESGLSPWLASIGLPDVGPVAAMARGAPPVTADGVTLFALSSQSLG